MLLNPFLDPALPPALSATLSWEREVSDRAEMDFWTLLHAGSSRDICWRKGSANECLIRVRRERRCGNHVGMYF